MSDIPKSFLVFLVFAACGLGLVIYFVSKQFLFRRYKRKAEAALQQGNYLAAINSFRRAEALWELNVTNQTARSYQRDLAGMEELLDGLEAAARAGGIILAVGEYRDAVKAVQSEFHASEVDKRSSTGRSYASAFIRMKKAQSNLRAQLAANL